MDNQPVQNPTLLELVARTEIGPSEGLSYRLFVKSLSKSSDNPPVILGSPDNYPIKFTEEKLGSSIFKVTDQIPSRFGSLGYFIESGNGFISLEWEPYNAAVDGQFPNQATDVATFKQILSTFKFTN